MNTKAEAQFETINKQELSQFATEVAKKHIELVNLIANSPLHFTCDLGVTKVFGQLSEHCNCSIGFPLVDTPESFEYMRE